MYGIPEVKLIIDGVILRYMILKCDQRSPVFFFDLKATKVYYYF